MHHDKYDGKHTENTSGSKRKPVIILVSLLVLISTLTGATIYFVSVMNNPKVLFTSTQSRYPATLAPTAEPTPNITEQQDTQQQEAGDTSDPNDTTPTPEPTPEYTFEQSRINVLVLGLDESPERVAEGQSFRTDTMILLSIDFDNNDVDMISLPRDSYVRINGGDRRAKLNSAYVYGGGAKKDGYQYVLNTVSWMMGDIDIDYYVSFGMLVVKDVVNAMGGIEYDVDVPVTMAGRKLETGQQHLNGQQVLDYCRYRGTPNADIGRIDRQQNMLVALFRQLKSTNQIKNIPKIYESVMSNLDTNLNLLQVIALAYWARNLDVSSIEKHTLEGSGLYIGSVSYWILNQTKKVELVKEVFGIDITVPQDEDYSSIKAMADAIAAKSSQVHTLMDPLLRGILEGYITDPAVIAAVQEAQAALITEKIPQLDSAIAALSQYANYNSSPVSNFEMPQETEFSDNAVVVGIIN